MDTVSSNGIRVSLEEKEKELWMLYYPDTEMVVHKAGRSLHPTLEYVVEGLLPDTFYTIELYFERVDDLKYTYSRVTGWEAASKGEPRLPIVRVQHPKGGRTGSDWMNGSFSFSNIRITNNPECKTNAKNVDVILLQSMHRYQPVVVIKRMNDGWEESFRLTMTEFFAVSRYRNESIQHLKTTTNKFARGYLPEGKHFEKRKRPAASYPTPPLSATPDTSGTSTPDSVASSSAQMAPWTSFQYGMMPAPLPPTPPTPLSAPVYPNNYPYPTQMGGVPWYPMMVPNQMPGASGDFQHHGCFGMMNQNQGPQYTMMLPPDKEVNNINFYGTNFNFPPYQ